MPVRHRRLLAIAIVFGVLLLNAASAQQPPVVTPQRNDGLLLSNVRVFDPVNGKFTGPIDVLVRDGRIAATGKLRSSKRGITQLDAGGRYAVPGLWDSHVHFSFLTLGGDSTVLATLEAFVRNGITSVRDVGGPLDTIAALSRRVAAGTIAGPRIYYAGPMLSRAPLWGFLEEANEALPGMVGIVDSPADVDTILNRLVAKGATMTKAIDRWDPPLLRYFVRGANARSLRVVLDLGLPIFNPIPIDTALALSVNSVEHAKAVWAGVLRDDLRREVDAFMAGGGSYASGEDLLLRVMSLGEESVSRERLMALADTWAGGSTYYCPTLRVAEDNLAENPSSKMRRPFEGLRAVSRLFVRELTARGVKILVGQDQVDPDGTLREMELLAGAGVSTVDILRGATINVARALGVEDSVGTLERGKRADILILDANPLERIENIRSVWRVVYGGRVLR